MGVILPWVRIPLSPFDSLNKFEADPSADEQEEEARAAGFGGAERRWSGGEGIPLSPFDSLNKFEADPSADEESEKSEGGRLRRRSASDGGEGIPLSPPSRRKA